MLGWLGPDLSVNGPDPFYGALEANEICEVYCAEITTMKQGDKTAIASIVENNLLGMSFDNHFHMAQSPDRSWRLSAKLSRHY